MPRKLFPSSRLMLFPPICSTADQTRKSQGWQ
jgi:hypothetical protein